MIFKRNSSILIFVLIFIISLTGCGLKPDMSRMTFLDSSDTTEKQSQKSSAEEETACGPEDKAETLITKEAVAKDTPVPDKTTAAKKNDKDDSDELPKALIVDNETGSSKRMKKYLKKAGFDVTMVDSMDFEVEDYDTLVIPGGHNITPSIYGAERDEHTYGTDEKIDELQIAAVKAFAEKEKPILGVCRGCQLVNVAFGGTINQHIPGWHKKNRRVKIERGSWLYYRLGTSESVYHYHHQCVEELGEGLVATMWDKKDGHIEGFEHESLPVYGIQWHPDSMGNRGIDVFRYYKEDILGMGTAKENEKDD